MGKKDLVHKIVATGIIFLFIVSSVGSIEKVVQDEPVESSDGPMDSPWPMFGHDIQRTGRSPYGSTGNTPVEKWTFWMDGMTISSPAIDENGTIYTGASSDRCLFALNPNGTEKWRFETNGYVLSSPAVGTDGIIYVGSNDGYLYAIYPNGTEKWRFDTGDWVFSSPNIDENGTIYVGSLNNNLYAINYNGTENWHFSTDDKIYSSPAIDNNGIIYFGSHDYHLYALYPNGTMKWRYETNAEIKSSPAIDDDGTVYVCSWDDYLYAIYPNGTLRWRFDTGAATETSPTIALDGTIYVGNYDIGRIFSINPDGTENWHLDAMDSIIGSPAVDKYGTIYVPSMDGVLYALNPDSSLKWEFSAGDKIESSVAIGEDGIIYFGASFLPPPDFYSYLYALEIIINEPPTKPTINGETNGKFGESYDYTFISTDPEGQNVWYYIEWGDGDIEEWIGPYSSGEEIVRSHTWTDQGEYTIRAKAKDIFDAESDWGTLEVTMPINQHSYSFPLLQWLLELFPNAFPILRFLLSK